MLQVRERLRRSRYQDPLAVAAPHVARHEATISLSSRAETRETCLQNPDLNRMTPHRHALGDRLQV